ncbi:CHAP domain-containing protein [Streptococcus caviae]|uniref:CHAP domain-containing protein n=1 Tax=Streptococcus sp. 'caviae' TaxID=1915004 RepID=UPI00094BAF1D|nr:CHAP domain-containing protein [Streptococcus sp. 'caviae']OLN84566.1 hypothetical protein BMI76_00345 [Streptococcus sp. 'caviae']
MVKRSDVVNWAKDLANRGVGVDYDGQYGTQCVDLVNWVFGKFFGRPLSGNAINLLDSAKQNGYTVIYKSSGVAPKAGDVFVMNSIIGGVNYGHTGLVIEDSNSSNMKTVEQNVDGNADALYVGGPARYRTRSLTDVIGWIRPKYEDADISKEEEEEDMFTISAPNRGIALVTGGVFYALLDAKDPAVFWANGVKNMKVSTKTFDNFQKGAVK